MNDMIWSVGFVKRTTVYLNSGALTMLCNIVYFALGLRKIVKVRDKFTSENIRLLFFWMNEVITQIQLFFWNNEIPYIMSSITFIHLRAQFQRSESSACWVKSSFFLYYVWVFRRYSCPWVVLMVCWLLTIFSTSHRNTWGLFQRSGMCFMDMLHLNRMILRASH